MIDTPFLMMMSDGSELFINLLHIVRTSGLGKDEITLHMSDGFAVTFKGSAVGPLVARISEMTMLGDGSNYAFTVRAARARVEQSSSLPNEAQSAVE